MDYVEIALLLGVLGLQIACLLGIHQASRARTASLEATIGHLEHVAQLLDAIAQPSQRVGTHAQQPGDGIRALRSRMAIRAAEGR